jgi:nickel/cobalt exporter
MKKINWIMLAGCCLVLFIAAHGLAAACGIKLSDKMGGWLPWIAGGALTPFGLYHVIQHIRGKGHGHSHLFGTHAHDGGEVEHGPHDGFLVNLGHGFVEVTIFETDVPPRFRLFFHDKHKQARSVPANATVKIETVRRAGTRQTFAFHAKGEYLESTTEIPEPHEFKAIVHVSHGSHTHTPHEVHFSGHDQAHHAHSIPPMWS